MENKSIVIIEKDTRKFLTDEEFISFKEKLETSYYEAAKLVPNFNVEEQAITKEQSEQIFKFLFRATPYSQKMEWLSEDISNCLRKNELLTIIPKP